MTDIIIKVLCQNSWVKFDFFRHIFKTWPESFESGQAFPLVRLFLGPAFMQHELLSSCLRFAEHVHYKTSPKKRKHPGQEKCRMLVHHNEHLHIFFTTEMLIKTILNSVTDDKSFVFKKVYEAVHQVDDTPMPCIVVEIVPRKNSPGVCPECGARCPPRETARKRYGYASNKSLQIMLYHALGKLLEPVFTHRFWYRKYLKIDRIVKCYFDTAPNTTFHYLNANWSSARFCSAALSSSKTGVPTRNAKISSALTLGSMSANCSGYSVLPTNHALTSTASWLTK